MRKMNSLLSALLLGGVSALTTRNLTRPQRTITFRYLSSMRCWNGLQITLSIVSLMGIPDIMKSRSTLTTKIRQLSHARMELMHTDECRSGCAMFQLLFNGA
jgi:hypothetical protein